MARLPKSKYDSRRIDREAITPSERNVPGSGTNTAQNQPQQKPSYESFQKRNFPRLAGALTRYINKTFGLEEDFVEIHIYDKAGNLLLSDENFTEFSTDSGLADSNLATEISIDPVSILKQRGYIYGSYDLVLNIQRNKFFNTRQRLLTIKEISTDRREIKAEVNSISNTVLERYFSLFKAELTSTPFFKDFVLNFGGDTQVSCINIGLDKRSGNKFKLLFRLLSPLPSNLILGNSFKVVEDIIDRIMLPVDLGKPQVSDISLSLQGPNFQIDTRANSSVPSEFKTYNDILLSKSTQSVTGSYLRIINALNNKEIPPIDYDYIRPISPDNSGSKDEGPFHFENFVHFGSAKERLKNFHYKLTLIELYNKQLKDINSITGPTSASSFVLTNKNSIIEKKERIIENLDGYEKFGMWKINPDLKIMEVNYYQHLYLIDKILII